MIDLSKHIQEGARLELEALELSTDECSFMSAQNSAQAMQIDELKRDLAAREAELAKARADLQFMVEKAAQREPTLDGYRELGAKCAALEQRAEAAERDAAKWAVIKDLKLGAGPDTFMAAIRAAIAAKGEA